jgi:hypothetical protein
MADDPRETSFAKQLDRKDPALVRPDSALDAQKYIREAFQRAADPAIVKAPLAPEKPRMPAAFLPPTPRPAPTGPIREAVDRGEAQRRLELDRARALLNIIRANDGQDRGRPRDQFRDR